MNAGDHASGVFGMLVVVTVYDIVRMFVDYFDLSSNVEEALEQVGFEVRWGGLQKEWERSLQVTYCRTSMRDKRGMPHESHV